MYEDDEDEEKDGVLKALSGEVDDYAGSQLKDPNEQSVGAGGATITITVKPAGAEQEEGESKQVEDAEGGEEHDPIAHVLGMCRGGCPGE